MQTFMQILLDAVSLGGLYSLYSLGIALVFGVSKIINFAQGAIITVSAYMLLVVGSLAWPIATIIVLLVGVFAALLTERIVFLPARNRGADGTTILIASFAVSVFLQNLLLLNFGARPLGVDFGSSLARFINLGSVQLAAYDLLTISVTVLALIALLAILRWTTIGLLIRAAALDETMLRLLGISSQRVILLTMCASGFLASLASLMMVLQAGSVSLSMGVQPVLIAFIATVIGGLGSLLGAVIVSFGLALATVALQEFLPADLLAFRTAILFLGIMVVLLVKPNGLFPPKTGERT